ncbi:hypothetical protein INT80_12340 [Gallibacterium anatis]|uniref:Uncharacterized protein n=1 Tax=Gallibacterium anatis TaxID=750 RepID=A0A930YAT6_9PAST|nr:hypothetical protein [Gallibacterium anatis]
MVLTSERWKYYGFRCSRNDDETRFRCAQSDKQRIITDKLGNKVVVYNPKLDWMMRKDDDDDTSKRSIS